jgi:hypothetical protein
VTGMIGNLLSAVSSITGSSSAASGLTSSGGHDHSHDHAHGPGCSHSSHPTSLAPDVVSGKSDVMDR